MDSINVYWEADGLVVVDIGEMELHMDRSEAEVLFVELGRTLQDMDDATVVDED